MHPSRLRRPALCHKCPTPRDRSGQLDSPRRTAAISDLRQSIGHSTFYARWPRRHSTLASTMAMAPVQALRFTHHSIGHSHTTRGAEEPLFDQDSNASWKTATRHERERRANRHHFMHQECGLAIVADTRNTREPRGSNGPVLPNAHLAMTYSLLGDPITTPRLALDVHMHMADMRTRP